MLRVSCPLVQSSTREGACSRLLLLVSAVALGQVSETLLPGFPRYKLPLVFWVGRSQGEKSLEIQLKES